MARSKVLSIEPEEVEDGTQSARITWLEEINMELLEACEAALPLVAHLVEYPGDPCEKVRDGLKDAIAKARGEGE